MNTFAFFTPEQASAAAKNVEAFHLSLLDTFKSDTEALYAFGATLGSSTQKLAQTIAQTPSAEKSNKSSVDTTKQMTQAASALQAYQVEAVKAGQELVSALAAAHKPPLDAVKSAWDKKSALGVGQVTEALKSITDFNMNCWKMFQNAKA